ncbi:hypothetical protein Leryth_026568, partial [Lithospermum erythrorhizon]
MENIGVSDSEKETTSEAEKLSLYPVVFGVSCAFSALGFKSNSGCVDEKWLEIKNYILKGSAHLLGLLVWRIYKEEAKNGTPNFMLKLKNVEREMEELKKQRSEDAKANEKVVGIFAAKEQGWFSEKKNLRQQLGALMNELRKVQSQKDKVISQLNEKLKSNEILIQSKDDCLKHEKQKRGELEEQLKKTGKIVEEMRVSFNTESQRHSAEFTKHKTVFIELVSNQRQLEAEISRVRNQFEAAKQELDSVLEQKEESVMMTQKLSMELVKMQKELEQKDQILSAMLRKSKVDTEEKEVLLKEVKLSKTKRKHSKLETEMLKVVSAAKHNKLSLKSILSKHSGFKLDASSAEGKRANTNESMMSYSETKEVFSTTSDEYSTKRNEEITNSEQYFERWVQYGSQRNNIASEQRHTLEIDAFAEQLRLKNEKFEIFQWHYLSMEFELKRLQSQVEGLNNDIVQLRQDNMELDALLLNRDEELRVMREQMALRSCPPICQTTNLKSSLHDPSIVPDMVWSKVKVIKKKHEVKDQGEKPTHTEIYPPVEISKDELQVRHHSNDIVLTLLSPDMKKTEASKVLRSPPESLADLDDVKNSQCSVGQSERNDVSSSWKMDLHALGVSFKIKRLKQQLVMLERLTGKKGNRETSERNDNKFLGQKSFYALLSLLNKHVGRYQSLQAKIDDICKSMHDHDPSLKHRSSKIAKTDEETKLLGHFLEETFQLQRYIVATGQKLMEVQAKITSGFLSSLEVIESPVSFDAKRFIDGIKNMFSEVQRGQVNNFSGIGEGQLTMVAIEKLRDQQC